MWSADCESFFDDDEVYIASYENNEDDGDSESDIETLLYTQVYHQIVEDDRRHWPAAVEEPVATAITTLESDLNAFESICDAKVRRKPETASESALSVSGFLRRKTAAVKTKKKPKKVIRNSVTKPTFRNGEVVITIKSDKRAKRKTSRASSTASSSSAYDIEDTILKPADISTMYTHLSVETNTGNKSLHKEIVEKKRKLSKFASDDVANSKRSRALCVSEESASCQATDVLIACKKAMSDFYTTLDIDTILLKQTMITTESRRARWSVLSMDRHCTKQTRGRFFMKCSLCNESGHLRESCPQAHKKPSCRLCGENHHMTSCDNRLCSICWRSWHPIRNCPANLDFDVYDSGCTICNRYGHYHYQCSDHWRKYHSTIESRKNDVDVNGVDKMNDLKPFNEIFCYNCGRRGHFGHECSARRMENNLVPFFPFVTNKRDRTTGHARNGDTRNGHSNKSKREYASQNSKDHLAVERSRNKQKHSMDKRTSGLKRRSITKKNEAKFENKMKKRRTSISESDLNVYTSTGRFSANGKMGSSKTKSKKQKKHRVKKTNVMHGRIINELTL